MGTRIVGGSAGGRRLRTLPGALTRPTSDRAREALFSSLESRLGSLAGLRFLDLFAGSGAVGLEARSRGAASVLLVERDRRAADLIRHNARSLALPVQVAHATVARQLRSAPPAPYDVVFADPPYAVRGSEVRSVLDALARRRWVATGAVVVVERSRRDPGVDWPAGYESLEVRGYGDTALAFGRWTADPAPLWYGREDPAVDEPEES